MAAGDRFSDIETIVSDILSKLIECDKFIVTHGQLGCVTLEKGSGAIRIPAFTKTVVDTGGAGDAAAQVLRLAQLAKRSGLDGVVCSAREAEALRAALGDDFKLVVPGIRPQWAAADDQKRIVTPAEAVAKGADYLVIGRPITAADDPADAARRIAAELDA